MHSFYFEGKHGAFPVSVALFQVLLVSVCRQVNVFSVQAVGDHNNLRVLKATTENHGSVFAAAPLCDQLTWTFANVLGNLHFW